ncbi:MAG: 50S ribosomal protein L6, partial [Clostridia bacterium]|nr:50S ribosomal protein L6 [Clostridia bacterium]
MSRIGKMPITVPAGVTVAVDDGNVIKVNGPKGELTQSMPQGIVFEQDNGVLTITRPNDSKEMRSCHGLSRALLANMVKGVTDGFTRALEIQGTGYRAAKAGDIVT